MYLKSNALGSEKFGGCAREAAIFLPTPMSIDAPRNARCAASNQPKNSRRRFRKSGRIVDEGYQLLGPCRVLVQELAARAMQSTRILNESFVHAWIQTHKTLMNGVQITCDAP